MLLITILQAATDAANPGSSDLKAFVDIAGALTVPACLLISVVALVKGWIVTPARLTDWQDRAKYEQDRGDRLEAALKESTNKIDNNTQALTSLREVISQISRRD